MTLFGGSDDDEEFSLEDFDTNDSTSEQFFTNDTYGQRDFSIGVEENGEHKTHTIDLSERRYKDFLIELLRSSSRTKLGNIPLSLVLANSTALYTSWIRQRDDHTTFEHAVRDMLNELSDNRFEKIYAKRQLEQRIVYCYYVYYNLKSIFEVRNHLELEPEETAHECLAFDVCMDAYSAMYNFALDQARALYLQLCKELGNEPDPGLLDIDDYTYTPHDELSLYSYMRARLYSMLPEEKRIIDA